MKQLAFLLLAYILLVQPCQWVESKVLLMSKATGSDHYLHCGDDQLCSMVDISNAQESDGWSIISVGGGHNQLIGRDGHWTLDVLNGVDTFHSQQGEKVWANTQINSGSASQQWDTFGTSDNGVAFRNVQFDGNLDFDGGVTPFVNPNEDDTVLSGQDWLNLPVYPQTTTTQYETITMTNNEYASSTVTVTITVCPSKRSHINGTPLHKRDTTGAGILATTTQATTMYSTTTIDVLAGTDTITTTKVVTSCAPVTQTQIQTQTQVQIQTQVSQTTHTVFGSTCSQRASACASSSGILSASASASASVTPSTKAGDVGRWDVELVLAAVFVGIAAFGPGAVF